jgi:hypothetical protein
MSHERRTLTAQKTLAQTIKCRSRGLPKSTSNIAWQSKILAYLFALRSMAHGIVFIARNLANFAANLPLRADFH